MYTTEEIVEGIYTNDNNVLNYTYKKFFPAIKYHIKYNKGNEEDAHDIFQEVLIVIYCKIKNDELVLNCNFATYFFSICERLWLKQLKNRKKIIYVDSLENHTDNEIIDWDKTERYRLYQKHYKHLLPDCKKILHLFLKKVPLSEIALIMDYTSEKYAKRKNFLCKQHLIKKIQNDDEFKNLVR